MISFIFSIGCEKVDQYQSSQKKALEAMKNLKESEAIFIKASDIHAIINNAGQKK